MLPTHLCPPYPPSLARSHPQLELPKLPNEAIDLVLHEVLRKGLSILDLPKTQFGRRWAVRLYLTGEQHGYASS